MNHSEISFLSLALEKILRENTDETHYVKMPEIQSALENDGIRADRRTIYKAFSAMKNSGIRIVYKSRHGYRMEHLFSEAEALILCDAVSQSPSLSKKESDILNEKIGSTLSRYQLKDLPSAPAVHEKAETETVSLISLLLEGIRKRCVTAFRYFDITVSGKKQYRREAADYRLVPYAIVSNGGRYYCIFYSPAHSDFANYRLDKMDRVRLTDEITDPVYFSLADHIRSSFQMYRGDPQTVIIKFARPLASLVYDQFGRDIIISAADADTFTAGIRTALTPTLISWLIQFEDRLTVLQPQELKDALCRIGRSLYEKYSDNKQGEES